MIYMNGKPVEKIETAEFGVDVKTFKGQKGSLLLKEKIIKIPGGMVAKAEIVECSKCGAGGWYAHGTVCPCCGCIWV